MDEQAGKRRDFGSQTLHSHSISDLKIVAEFLEEHLIIIIEKGDRAEEGDAYRELGIVYFSLGDFRKAIEYHIKHLQKAIETSDQAGEGGAYGNLGKAYFFHLVTSEKPLSIMKNCYKLQTKSVIGLEKDEPMQISVLPTSH